jgi:hypothetical protein
MRKIEVHQKSPHLGGVKHKNSLKSMDKFFYHGCIFSTCTAILFASMLKTGKSAKHSISFLTTGIPYHTKYMRSKTVITEYCRRESAYEQQTAVSFRMYKRGQVSDLA